MLDWVIPVVLARSCRPGWAPGGRRDPVGPDVLSAWIREVKMHGIRSVLVLLADEHMRLYDGEGGGLLTAYEANGLVVAHVPAADHQFPPLGPGELDAAFQSFCALPRPTLIHCSAGIDRTGAAIRHILARRGEWMSLSVGDAAGTPRSDAVTTPGPHTGSAGAEMNTPIQAQNVGNRGDTLKHAPIPDLIRVLLAVAGRVTYFDPFAFALEYPLSPSVGFPRWLDDLRVRRRTWPAYDRLQDIQGPRLAAGSAYRCGIGLALDAIGPERLSWLLAAERDPGLRIRLEAGLREMGLAGSLVGGAVQPDAAGIPGTIAGAGASVQAGDGLFALIDPFTIRRCPWRAVLEGLALAIRPGAHAIALVFTSAPHDWPPDLSPAGALRRVRWIGEGPFELAVYATEALTDDVARVLDEFGWI